MVNSNTGKTSLGNDKRVVSKFKFTKNQTRNLAQK